MPRAHPIRVFVEDLFWLRGQLKEKVRSGRLEERLVPKANRMYALVADLCDDYQESERNEIHISLTVLEKG